MLLSDTEQLYLSFFIDIIYPYFHYKYVYTICVSSCNLFRAAIEARREAARREFPEGREAVRQEAARQAAADLALAIRRSIEEEEARRQEKAARREQARRQEEAARQEEARRQEEAARQAIVQLIRS